MTFMTFGFYSFIFFFLMVSFPLFLYSRRKVTPFECGFSMSGFPSFSFSVHFFFILLIFVIFDLEIVFFFGLVLTFSQGFFLCFFFWFLICLSYYLEFFLGSFKWRY